MCCQTAFMSKDGGRRKNQLTVCVPPPLQAIVEMVGGLSGSRDGAGSASGTPKVGLRGCAAFEDFTYCVQNVPRVTRALFVLPIPPLLLSPCRTGTTAHRMQLWVSL